MARRVGAVNLAHAARADDGDVEFLRHASSHRLASARRQSRRFGTRVTTMLAYGTKILKLASPGPP